MLAAQLCTLLRQTELSRIFLRRVSMAPGSSVCHSLYNLPLFIFMCDNNHKATPNFLVAICA